MIATLDPIFSNLSSTGNSATTTDTTDTKGTSNDAAALGKEDFLSLLVSQLKAQDPLSPMEGADFTAQLAQFSSLEQLTNVNDNLAELTDFQESLYNSSLLNLIGKDIDLEGNTVDYASGESVDLDYTLDAKPASTSVEIFDNLGTLVATLTDSAAIEGSNKVVWNGKDSKGNEVKDGLYTFKVTALDDAGESIGSKEFISGTVDEIQFENGTAFAVVNGEKIDAGEITRVVANS